MADVIKLENMVSIIKEHLILLNSWERGFMQKIHYWEPEDWSLNQIEIIQKIFCKYYYKF